MRELSISAGKDDCYTVISKKYKKGKLIRTDTYNVDLRNHYCSCKGFWFMHKCPHIDAIIDILKSKGIGIYWNQRTNMRYTNWDFQDIDREIKNVRIEVGK